MFSPIAWIRQLFNPGARPIRKSARRPLYIETLEDRVVPAAPVAVNDLYAIHQGSNLSVTSMDGVLNNDYDPDLDPMTAVLVSGPSHQASFTLYSDGSFSYTAATGYVGTDTFTYKPNDGTQDGNTATVTIEVKQVITAAGALIMGLEQQSTSGVVASFTTNDSSAAATDFTAIIRWGDSSYSAGTISANGGAFDVSGSHDYTHNGSYAVAVQILGTVDNEFAVVGSYAVALAVDNHAAVQTIVDSDLDWDGTFSAYISDMSGYFYVSGSGSYSYTLTVSSVDGLYSTVEATYSGEIDITLTETIYASATSLGLEAYDLDETGSVDIDLALATSDLDGSSTRSETGTKYLSYWSKTGNDTANTYDLSASTSAYLTLEEDGVYGGLAYHYEESASTSDSLSGSGNYYTDVFYESLNTSVTSSWTETGTLWTTAYSTTGGSNNSLTLSETGALATGNYTASGSGSLDPTTITYYGDGVATGSAYSHGYPPYYSISKSFDWSTGDYSWTQTITAENTAGYGSYTNQTASGNNTTWSSATTTTILQTGNVLTGDYERSIETDSSAITSYDDENQDLSDYGYQSNTSDSLLEQTGNLLSGDYSLEDNATWDNSGYFYSDNQYATANSHGSASGTSTLERSGNTVTGAYTFTLATTSESSSHAEGDNQNNSYTSDTTDASSSETTETGNTLTGAYSQSFTSNSYSTSEDSSETPSTLDTTSTTLTSETGGTDSGDYIAGTYDLAQETVSTFTNSWTTAEDTTGSAGAYTIVTTTNFESSGDLSTGDFSDTTLSSWYYSTANIGGVDARGTYFGEITGSGESTTIHLGNTVTAADTLDVTSDSTVTQTRENVGGDTNYEQTIVTVNHAESYATFNAVTRAYSNSSSSSSSITFDEGGDYLGTVFSIHSEDTAESTTSGSGNTITGAYTQTVTLDTTSELYAFGDDGAANMYEHWKTSYSNLGSTTTGNAITGEYSTSGDSTAGSTAYEENTYATGSASFTEVLFESFSFGETGNTVVGNYDRDETSGVRWSTLTATTTIGANVFTVTQTVNGTFTRHAEGNTLAGNDLTIEEATDVYEVVQVGIGTQNFTLTINGTNTYTDEEEGDGYTGDYERTKTGTDDYTMVETGTKVGGTYSQTITGTDTYTLIDEGNLATGHYERTITGGGSYNRTTTGAGATLPTDTGTTSYGWDQEGDPQSGVFDLTQSGTTRYSLLEDFYDISNTSSAQAMGHMNVYPYGQTFVDPPPDLILFTPPPFDAANNLFFRWLMPAPRMATVPITSLTGRTLQRYLESLETRAAQGIGDRGLLTPAQLRNLIAQMQREGWRSAGRGVEMEWVGGAHINFIGPAGQTLHLPVPPGFVP